MDVPETPAPTAAPGPGRKELKIVIVGDGGCGKTSLLMVYSQGSFPEVRPSGVLEAGGRRGSGSGPLGTRDGPRPAARARTPGFRRPDRGKSAAPLGVSLGNSRARGWGS